MRLSILIVILLVVLPWILALEESEEDLTDLPILSALADPVFVVTTDLPSLFEDMTTSQTTPRSATTTPSAMSTTSTQFMTSEVFTDNYTEIPIGPGNFNSTNVDPATSSTFPSGTQLDEESYKSFEGKIKCKFLSFKRSKPYFILSEMFGF